MLINQVIRAKMLLVSIEAELALARTTRPRRRKKKAIGQVSSPKDDEGDVLLFWQQDGGDGLEEIQWKIERSTGPGNQCTGHQ